jgi:beta-lactamase regulating signal transducer with metallopeptidase domain/peroxiredoxin
MNDTSIWTRSLSSLTEAGIGPVLVAKWTLLLALAWMAHAALVGRNPRWRVALWRGAMLGVALVAALAFTPPIVPWPVARPMPGASFEQPAATNGPSRSEPDPSRVVMPAPASRTTEHREAVDSIVPPMPSPELVAMPESTDAPPVRALGLATSWALWVWFTGVLVLIARLTLASVALGRLIHRSSDAPDEVAHACRAISEDLGYRRAIRVVHSADIATPCTAGLLRPVLLLPEGDREENDDLRAILAHELAHVRNHDPAWNLVAHLATILLWFHPLVWRLRSAHEASCEAVSDAVAADYVGDVATYGRTLARLAVYGAAPGSAHVLAMARMSEVWRRLEALNRHVFRARLAPGRIVPALSIGAVVLLLIGGFGFTRTGQETQRKEIPARPGLTLRAVEAVTGKPIADATISYEGSFAGTAQSGTLTTGDDGTATIDHPSGAVVDRLEIKSAPPKRVPIYLTWRPGEGPIALPAAKELRFQPGTTIGGIVKDEAGRPLSGAKIVWTILPTERVGAWEFWSFPGPTTDEHGRWRMDHAPADLSRVQLDVVHPDYRTGRASASRNLESVTALRRGYPVRGRVVDAEGRPVRGARVFAGPATWDSTAPKARTDAQGEFLLERCAEGMTVVTVQAEGLAPQLRDVAVDTRTARQDFRLEPGSVLRVKIADTQGKSIPGAFVYLQAWRGHRSIDLHGQTDAQGQYTWRGAPGDAVLYDFGKDGYMYRRQIPLVADGREHAITLYPALVITGRVTDAETGLPLPKFRLVTGVGFRGEEKIFWSRREEEELSGGVFRHTFTEPNHRMYVRVEAVGYEPGVSRGFVSEEGPQRCDFALKRADATTALVQLADGKPAAGIDVVLATERDQVVLENGRIGTQANAARFRTAADGRFTFTAPEEKFRLIAMGDLGYAEVSSDEFERAGKIVLQPWGRIEGEVLVGGRPRGDEEVAYNPMMPPHRGNWRGTLINYYTTKTDDRGHFQFDRVIPGPGSVSRMLSTSFGRLGQQMPVRSKPVEVKPGGVAMVQFADKGRPVIGHVVLDGVPDRPIDWTRTTPASLTISDKEGVGGLVLGALYKPSANLDKDGRFRFEDIPPGTHGFYLSLMATYEHGEHNFPRSVIAEVGVSTPEIVADPSGEPFDLGTIKVKLFDTLGPGDHAPDLDILRIAGKGKGDRIRLSDERGRVVVVTFWFSGCNECRSELIAMKAIQKEFAESPFTLISLACGESPDQAKQVIRDQGLTWTHGVLDRGQALDTFKVRTIPTTFVIGPDGRILAKNPQGAALKAAIARALASAGDSKGGSR